MPRNRSRRARRLASAVQALTLAILFAAPPVAAVAVATPAPGDPHHTAQDSAPAPSASAGPRRLMSATDQIFSPAAAAAASARSAARRIDAAGPGPFLTRPYWNWHGVNSIFDHCNPTYAVDGRLCNVDGSVDLASYGSDPYFPKGYPTYPGGTDYVYYDGHNGWDIALNYETVLAAAPGTVTYANWDYPGCSTCGYGQTVIIDHGNGISTRYAHLSQIWVSTGQQVYRGQPVGVSGATGNVTGPHLHFGVYLTGSWTAVDPWGWESSSGDPWPYDQGDLWISGNPVNPVPSAPTGVQAAPGDSSALVSWTPPSFDGGTAISKYTIIANPGGASTTAGPGTTSAVVTGLSDGTSYSFTVAASSQAGAGPASASSAPVTPVGAHPQYFAEGTTRPGFQEYLTLLNTGGATDATIKYMFAGGAAPRYQIVSLAAHSRATVDVNAFLRGAADASAVVDAAAGGVVAERVLYFKACVAPGVCADGGAAAVGVQPSRTWYFAEGTTRPGFQEFLSILNPGSTSASVAVTYLFAGGRTMVRTYTVAPASRSTIGVNGEVGAGQDVSMSIASDQPVVAERPIYFHACTITVCADGGDVSAGTQPATSWDFAEGTTRPGFDEFLTILNPGTQTATVTARFAYGPGQTGPSEKVFQVAPGRFTTYVDGDVGPGRDVSVSLTSTAAVVAERPMYFNACPGSVCMNGGDVGMGAAPAQAWYLAEGYTGTGFQEYLTLENPGPSAGTVTVTFLFPDGTTSSRTVTVTPSSRATLDVNSDVGSGRQVSAEVSSTVPVVTERPIYFNACPGSVCANGGSVASGVTQIP